MTDTVTLSSPDTFAASIPSLVGFYPSESIVVVYLGGKSVIVTMRVDLPEWQDRAEFMAAIPDYVTKTASKVGADGCLIAIYTGHDGLPYSDLIEATQQALLAENVALRDAMLIDDGRRYSYLCDGDCCPSGGVPIPESSILEVWRVAAGDPPLGGSREEIVARFTPHPELGPSDDLMIEATAVWGVEPSVRAKQAWEAVKTLVQNRSHPGDETKPLQATVILAVQQPTVRDYVMVQALKCDDYIPYVDMIVSIALVAPENRRKQICGMASALMMTLPSHVGSEAVIALAEDESIVEMVKGVQSVPLSPGQFLEVVLSTESAVLARLAQDDREFRKNGNQDPMKRELRKRRNR